MRIRQRTLKQTKNWERAQDRIEYLVARLSSSRESILIPTPVLTEFLVLAGDDGPDYMAEIDGHSCLRVAVFDQKAAVELAAITRKAYGSGDKKSGSEETWAKVKFDRQIVSIGAAEGAHTVYSNDRNLSRFAQQAGMLVVSVFELDLPPAKTAELPFGEPGPVEREGQSDEDAAIDESEEEKDRQEEE